jgi:hypothetical protein
MSGIHQLILSSASEFIATFGTTTDLNVRSGALAQGWDGTSKLKAFIVAGAVISASSTTTYAVDIDGSFPAGLELTIEGTVNGVGGQGGAGGVNAGNGVDGSVGGNAIRATVACIIKNFGAINSGGGGQGGGAAVRTGGTSGTTTAGCGLNIACQNSPFCSNGFCNTNTGTTGASGTSNGVNGAAGANGSSVSYGTSAGCAAPCGSGPGCNGIANCTTGSPGNGGLAGASIVGIGNVTLTNSGTINGGFA